GNEAGYGNDAGRRAEPAPHGYGPVTSGYPPAGRPSADLYDEETRYAPQAAPSGPPPVDPGIRDGERAHRSAAARSRPATPASGPSPGPGPRQTAVSRPRPTDRQPHERPYPPDTRAFPSGGPAAGQPLDPGPGYPEGSGGGGWRDSAARAASPVADAHTAGGFPPAQQPYQDDARGQAGPAAPRRAAQPPGRGSGWDPGTQDAAASTSIRRPREPTGRPAGVAPPRTTRVRADAAASDTRRPSADRADRADRPVRTDRSTNSAAHGQAGNGRSERVRGRRRDDRGNPSFSDEDTGSHRAQPRKSAAGTPMLRRLLYAVVILGLAFALGGGAGFVWQKISPGKASVQAGPTAAPTGTAQAAASASPAASPAGTTAPAVVPADWVAVTDTKQRATFSHPPAWSQRRDNTGVFFVEPAVGTAAAGPRMVGVARVTGTDQRAALKVVQDSEFATQPGLTQDRSGPITDPTGAQSQELAGSYLRDGQRVTYVMRTLLAGDAVYVLISRSSATQADTATTLVENVRASFRAS
ncbi:hypothetical protein, partial [Frankia sp. Cj3]|uniref:hypothetical protein n=1 Tax=Frankia sp. Cj3 TaxID=2880976 RepID=UPI001EF5A4B0